MSAVCYNDDPKVWPYVRGNAICPYQNVDDSKCPTGYLPDVMLPATSNDNPSFCFGDFVQKIQRVQRKCVLDWSNPGFNQTGGLFNCCNGKTDAGLCPPGYCRNSAKCDAFMTQYCQTNPDVPECGCLMPASRYNDTSKFGPIECVDTRCTRNPSAYRRSDQLSTSCKITNCSISGLTINASNSSIANLETLQQCGNSPNSSSPTTQSQGSNISNLMNKRTIAIASATAIVILSIILILRKR